jgi:hypothetical protein
MGRLDRISVVTSRGVVEISWMARRELLLRLPTDSSGANVVSRFTAVGATRPVELDDQAELVLREIVTRWLDENGDTPPGIVELGGTLGYAPLAPWPAPADRAQEAVLDLTSDGED